MRLDNLPADGQPQSGSFSIALTLGVAEIAISDMGQDIPRDARAVILYFCADDVIAGV